jgi:hypothetical protein
MKNVDDEERNETECVVDDAGPIAKRFKSSDVVLGSSGS